ncbi:MAG: glycosyltransferase [Cyanobacteria bacterium]|jgi:glycosyltransferase involved in cell wall biosynthesis|nr:glycosyltransferase [Cyanobacteria bacterium GSL.Bin21]
MNKSIAILVWGLRGGSLTNYTTALVWGLWKIGVKNLSIYYVATGIGPHVTFPKEVELVHLGTERVRKMPLQLAKSLRKKQPDFLIAISSFVSIPAIIGWLLAGKIRTKIIVSQHCTMSYKAYIENKNDWKVRVQPWLVRLLYPFANGLHANSQEVLDDLLNKIGVKFPPEKTFVTPNPINIEAIINYSQAESEHPWLQHKKHPVIISVGRLAKQKNFSLLFAAFQIVKQTVDAKLIVLGEGKERAQLERSIHQFGIEKSVSLAGFSANPWASMAKADLFVLSSDEESFGLVIVEAMACSLPVIATDAIGGGPKTILDGGKYGKLVATNNAQVLAKAMVEILTNSHLKNRLIAAGKERCQIYKPRVIAQQWLAFLEQL